MDVTSTDRHKVMANKVDNMRPERARVELLPTSGYSSYSLVYSHVAKVVGTRLTQGKQIVKPHNVCLALAKAAHLAFTVDTSCSC